MKCAPVLRSLAFDGPQQVRVTLDLPATLPCFAGHFPGFPVLPGVVQIDWVMQLAAAHLRCAQRPAAEIRVKFKRVVTPGSPLGLTLRHDTARQRLAFTYTIGDSVASQGQIMLPP